MLLIGGDEGLKFDFAHAAVDVVGSRLVPHQPLQSPPA